LVFVRVGGISIVFGLGLSTSNTCIVVNGILEKGTTLHQAVSKEIHHYRLEVWRASSIILAKKI
jgi:hypothetical protein